MIERRALTMSLTLAMLAMYLVFQYVSGEDAKMRDQYETFYPMVVASRDILQYQTIRPTDIETIRVPKAMEPPGLIGDPKDVIDAVAAVPITRGEQILDNKIISKNVYSGLDTQIALGRRALSMPVTAKSALGYNIRPGNRVDLATYFEYKTNAGAINEVKVFMQDVLVLASGKTIQAAPPKGVDQEVVRNVAKNTDLNVSDPVEIREMLNHAKSDANYQTITLEVTPQQAQILVYVMSVFPDTLTVMLRHSDDRVMERRETTNLFDVMGPDSYLVRGKKAPPARAIPRPKFFDLQGDQSVGVPN